MNAAFETKKITLKALDVDTTTRQVKIGFAQLQDIDTDNDVFDKSAFNKTIREQGPSGANRVWHLADHEAKLKSGFGKFKELGVDGIHVYGVSQYKDSYLWREIAWPLYESGDITEHSVGFSTNKSITGSRGERIIMDVTLWEGSSVIFGANADTPTMDVIKSMDKAAKIDHYDKKFTSLINAIKMGKFEDDNSIMLIEIKQLQQAFYDLSKDSTTPVDAATEPEMRAKTDAMIKELKEFTQKIFS